MGEAPWPRAILHVDMDAFYASVEVLDDPTLAGLPLVVGGSPQGRGVVSAASYEARRFGVHSAMPAARALGLCPRLVFRRPRMERYAEVSRRIFAVFDEFTPDVQALSIDEAFLDVTRCQRLLGSPPAIAARIKDRVREATGLTASVGVAPSKFVAKLASDLEKPDGLVVIRPEEVEARLARLPVRSLMGVGAVLERRLHAAGVYLVRHLLERDEEELVSAAGDQVRELRRLARGIDARPVVRGGPPRSIGAECTFARDIGDEAELRRVLDRHVERVAERLRRQGFRCRTVTVKARFPDFRTLTRARTLEAPTARTDRLRAAARELLEERVERGGRPLRLLGVSLSNLVREGEEGQRPLFEDPEEGRARRVDELMDRIRRDFGRDKLARANVLGPGPRGDDREE